MTLEAKVEHEDGSAVDAHAVGHAHNQASRAWTELSKQGYAIRGVIVTHLEQLDPAAAASIGIIKVVRTDAVTALWTRVNELLGVYASNWSADLSEARPVAADSTSAYLPPAGWLLRALDTTPVFVDGETLMHEWSR